MKLVGADLENIVVYPVFRIKRLKDFAAFEKKAKLKIVKPNYASSKKEKLVGFKAILLLDGMILEYVVHRWDMSRMMKEQGFDVTPTSPEVMKRLKALYGGFLENGYIEGDFEGVWEFVIPPKEG